MNAFIKNIINNFLKFFKKSKNIFVLALIIIIIYILICYCYNFQEGNTSINTEQSTDTGAGGGTTFYDPTVKDKIKNITTIIDEKEIENKEKLAKLNILVTDIETDINRMVDRDEGLAELINPGDE